VRGLIEYVVATAVTFEDKVDLKSFKNNIMLRNPCSESGSEVNCGCVGGSEVWCGGRAAYVGLSTGIGR
jgi:hypothetical protein